MKNLVAFVLFLAILAGGLFAIYQTKHTLDPQTVLTYSYCDKPITYRVDTVDPKFGISRQEFMNNITTSTQLWNDQYPTPLFQFDPQGDLSINLIYDDRQTLENKISDLEEKIDSNKTPLQTRINDYNRLSEEFKQKADALNRDVQDWNTKGGAPPEVYDQLTQRQQALRQEADRLSDLAEELHQSTTAYNSEITNLNQTVDTFNDAIAIKPEEGIYRGDLNRIEIYFNISPAELNHTITHELGHSLGIPHNNNPKSIMYPSSTQTLKLTDEDKQALTDICQRRSIFEPIYFYLQSLKHRVAQLT